MLFFSPKSKTFSPQIKLTHVYIFLTSDSSQVIPKNRLLILNCMPMIRKTDRSIGSHLRKAQPSNTAFLGALFLSFIPFHVIEFQGILQKYMQKTLRLMKYSKRFKIKVRIQRQIIN